MPRARHRGVAEQGLTRRVVTHDRAAQVLDFWFGDALESDAGLRRQHRRWFRRSDAFDAAIAARFASLPERAQSGLLDDWQHEASAALALVLALDQFPRNLYRDSARAFAYDVKAQRVAERAVGAGHDEAMHPIGAAFLYMPFEHAECLEQQQRCVALFERLAARAPASLQPHIAGFLGYARRHRAVIEQLGRFPHRNAVLGRASTPTEIAYLRDGGERFGAYI